jgi:hypothetical protein
MRKFETPVMEVIQLDTVDIVTASPDPCGHVLPDDDD